MVLWRFHHRGYGGRGTPSPPGFAEVFILKGDEVVCFDTDSQVFIVKVLKGKTHLGWAGDTVRVEVEPHTGRGVASGTPTPGILGKEAVSC